MTGLIIPIANFVRGIVTQDAGTLVNIDYNNYLPISDLEQMNRQYQAGIYPTDPNVYADWKIDEQISFQIEAQNTPTFQLYTGSTLVNSGSGTDITPVGWVGMNRYKYTYTITVAGYYYLWVVVPGATFYTFKTDIFKVKDTLSDDKDLVEIQFYSDENKNGFVFDGYYKAYYTGQIKNSPQQRNSSIIEEDISYLLASKSYIKKTVTLTDIHHTYYDVVAKQLENEYIKLNGLLYVCKEPPEFEYKDKSDLIDITFELTAKYDNNYMNIP